MLRRLPTSRLLTLCALAAAATIAVGAAAAGAFGGSGPVPPKRTLPVAIHRALAAPQVTGVTATIDFTDKLIDTSGIRGANPLLSGGSGRLWATRDQLRLELQAPSGSEGAGDVQIVVDHNNFSLLDVASNTLYRGSLPADAHPRAKRHEAVPSVATIQGYIKRVAQHLTLTGPTPSDVAGRPAYGLTVAPKNGAGLIGGVRVAWDAGKGVPLSVAVYARGASSPTLSLRATQISFGAVPASTFALSPPPHAKVVDLTSHAAAPHAKKAHRTAVRGLAAVQAKLPFKLSAPAALAGRRRAQVSLLGADGAAVGYGQGLGGIVVVERKADPKAAHTLTLPSSGGRHQDVQLPTVQVPGATATEIATPLGTLIHFSRGGIDYTVLGSVTKATAESAARAL